jgi:hypothetical protein
VLGRDLSSFWLYDFSFRRADGRSLHVRKATRPETELAEIYQSLNLNLNLNPLPGGVQKTIV